MTASPTQLPDVFETIEKTFTLEEANRALPYVQRVVEDVVEVYRLVMHLRRQLDAALARGDETAGEAETLYGKAMDRLGELVDEMSQVGCELRDFERGVVDFPAEWPGQDIVWCWRLGEDAVEMWHDVDTGFQGRQPVEML